MDWFKNIQLLKYTHIVQSFLIQERELCNLEWCNTYCTSC